MSTNLGVKRFLNVLLPVFMLAAMSQAWADYQSGVAAYQQGEYEQALAEWARVIESPPESVHPAERAETLYAVAMLFWMGQGVQQDTAQSAGFLRQAAELNHTGAQSKLGYLFLIGQGVPQNNAQAQKWLEMAARQGDPDAQYNLGVVYRDGLGTAADEQQALRWFREAAANGDAYSAQVVAAYERDGVLQQSAELAQVSSQELPLAEEGQVSSEPEQISPPPEPPADIQISPADTDPAMAEALVEAAEPSNTSGIDSLEPGPVEAGKNQLAGPSDASEGEDWILLRQADHYTIQVMALKNRDNLNKLIDAHPQLKPMAVYRQGKTSDPLYVLIQGDYADVESARAATAKFPRSLAKPDQLWIRRFEMVQGLIATNLANNRAE